MVSSLFLSGAGVAFLLQLLLLFWPGMALSWMDAAREFYDDDRVHCLSAAPISVLGCIVTGGSLPLAMCLCKKYMGRMDMCHESAYRQADKLFISI